MLHEGKYPDDGAKRVAIKLLKIFSSSLLTLKDYKFNGQDPSNLQYKFYISIIKHDPSFNNGIQILPRLMGFLENYRANTKMYVENGKLCVEINVRRR